MINIDAKRRKYYESLGYETTKAKEAPQREKKAVEPKAGDTL